MERLYIVDTVKREKFGLENSGGRTYEDTDEKMCGSWNGNTDVISGGAYRKL